jgi:COP9 signalosome complex subunit 6
MAETSANSLVSTKPSDSGLHVALHPLVLLTISDHITRHTARQQQGPIVGALLGQQQGREISLEHAFECQTIKGSHDEILLHHTWFDERVKQCTISHAIYRLAPFERVY